MKILFLSYAFFIFLNIPLFAMQPIKKYDERNTQLLRAEIERIEKNRYRYICQKPTIKALIELIEKGADPTTCSSISGRNIFGAVNFCDKVWFEYLRKKGMNIDHQDHEGDRILIQAFCCVIEMNMIIAAGADINFKSGNLHQTPLMRAILLDSHLKYDVVDILLRAGADVFLQDDSGDTALHIAVRQNKPALVRRFFKPSNNPSGIRLRYIPNKLGITPADIARENYKRNAALGDSLEEIAYKINSAKIVSILLERPQKLK